MPHLHLPLQSGSDTVLRRMARRYKTQEFAEMVSRLRQINPLINITTDIIVGFPGETEEE
jgi:threonylcarbamoyladenosine tRNA methylthiotransferase MtaB